MAQMSPLFGANRATSLAAGPQLITGNRSVMNERIDKKASLSNRSKSISHYTPDKRMCHSELSTMSPKDVIYAARQESFQPRLKSKPRPFNISLSDHIDMALKKDDWGIENYQPRNPTLNLVASKANLMPKQKRETFMVTIPRQTAYVPGPEKHSQTYNWSEQKPRVTQKWSKSKNISFISAIEKNNKVPEKSTPAPSAYESMTAFKFGAPGSRIKGASKIKDYKYMFTDEIREMARDTPGPIYNIVDPVSIPLSSLFQVLTKEERHPFVRIHKSPAKGVPDIETERARMAPSPSTYLVAEAFERTSMASPRPPNQISLQLTSKRRSFVDLHASSSLGPGPVGYAAPIESLSRLTRGLGQHGTESRKRL